MKLVPTQKKNSGRYISKEIIVLGTQVNIYK